MASLGRWPIANNRLPRTARALAAAAVMAVAPPAQAVSFQIESASLMPGAGYGQDTGRNAENGGKQLDVTFINTAGGQTFSLNQVGDVFKFNVGTVSFQEPDTGEGNNRGINISEDDELGVLASFTFHNPVDAIQSRTALGTAIVGAIAENPEAVDYTLTWEPLLVGFGLGGLFEFDLLDLSFSNTGTQTLTATVKLLALPHTPSAPTPTVAEPATLALFGLGIAGIGATRRRRFAA